jgi:hypothetical protein
LKIKTWIFVTGTPRSGTTFLGKVLSARLEVDYIHEPFNPDCGIPGIEQRYLYLRPGSGGRYDSLIEKIFTYDFKLRTGYYQNDSRTRRLIKRLVGSRGPFYLRFAKLNPFHTAAIIKDPVGCLLTEYLSASFDVKPVIVVRHPVTFVASIRRLGWQVNLEPLATQSELVEDYFAEDPHFSDEQYTDTIERGAALWRALNKVLLAQARRNPDWPVITHEELSARPLDIVSGLYDRLGLTWSARVERMILANTRAKGRAEASSGKVQDFKRDSAQLFDLRMKMMSPDERRRIFEITRDVAEELYPRTSFGLAEKDGAAPHPEPLRDRDD